MALPPTLPVVGAGTLAPESMETADSGRRSGPGLVILCAGLWLAVSLGAFAYFRATHTSDAQPVYYITGDEPHYLVIATSLQRDGDLDVHNNYREISTTSPSTRTISAIPAICTRCTRSTVGGALCTRNTRLACHSWSCHSSTMAIPFGVTRLDDGVDRAARRAGVPPGPRPYRCALALARSVGCGPVRNATLPLRRSDLSRSA